MTINQLYNRYALPIHLRRHMVRAAALGRFVANHITQVQIEKELLTQILLVHDLGNILKFDFSLAKEFFVKEDLSVNFYRQQQQMYQQKFGSTPDEATLTILDEAKIAPVVRDKLSACHVEHLTSISETDDWVGKLFFYADSRISPQGLVSLDERFRDLKVRYPNSDMTQSELLCTLIESQLQEQARFPLAQIREDHLAPLYTQLWNYTL